jgi:hypothetical protein
MFLFLTCTRAKVIFPEMCCPIGFGARRKLLDLPSMAGVSGHFVGVDEGVSGDAGLVSRYGHARPSPPWYW